MIQLAPVSLAEWATTDAEWWQELAAAKTSWMQGRDAGRAAIQNRESFLAARKGA